MIPGLTAFTFATRAPRSTIRKRARRSPREEGEPRAEPALRRPAAAKALRAIVEELVKRGEIEIVDTAWGREFRRVR
jgi:hypothetical protein